MVKSAELRKAMEARENIRNISIIGQYGHGKSTVAASLLDAAGIIVQEEDVGDAPMKDTLADNAEHSMTIKSTGFSLYYKMNNAALKSSSEGRYLLNLVDSPGHFDFSSEVTAALHITDGTLCVVDCIEGIRTPTEIFLRQALEGRIRPVLVLNKLDRCFQELNVDGERAYQTFKGVIDRANTIMSLNEDPLLGDVKVSPENGTVAFSSGLHGWAFTLPTLAKVYASIYKGSTSKWLSRMWGENYYDPNVSKRNRWTTKKTSSETCKRGFVHLCYEPLMKVISACMNDDKDRLWPILKFIGVTLNSEEKQLMGEELVTLVMQKRLPAAKVLIEMMINHLPSPLEAQKMSVENLYKDSSDDVYANAIRNCDPDGPLMLYVSKMIPTSDRGNFFAFGRVFSGRISPGLKVRIMVPNDIPGEKTDIYAKTVEKTLIWMGQTGIAVEEVPCGNTVVLLGLEFYTNKATLTNETETNACPIRAIKCKRNSPVVRVTVRCEVADNLPKLVQGLKSLTKSDPLVVCTIEEDSGKPIIIAGASEVHLGYFLKDLREHFMDGDKLVVSDYFVSFCETVNMKEPPQVTKESPNKLRQLTMKATPLDISLAIAIDNGEIGPHGNPDVRGKKLSEFYSLKKYLEKNIWCFGPETTGPNMLVDMRKGVYHINQIDNSVVAGFQAASKEGALAKELMRGISFEMLDAVVDADETQSDYYEMVETAKSVIHSSQLAAEPRFMEPIYLAEFQLQEKMLDGMHNLLTERRGSVYKEIQRAGTDIYNIMAYLPVVESSVFSDGLKTLTSGQAFPQFLFDYWEIIKSDPLVDGTVANRYLRQIRKRKGLKEQINFEDETTKRPRAVYVIPKRRR